MPGLRRGKLLQAVGGMMPDRSGLLVRMRHAQNRRFIKMLA
jgi:hypothetical protein